MAGSVLCFGMMYDRIACGRFGLADYTTCKRDAFSYACVLVLIAGGVRGITV